MLTEKTNSSYYINVDWYAMILMEFPSRGSIGNFKIKIISLGGPSSIWKGSMGNSFSMYYSYMDRMDVSFYMCKLLQKSYFRKRFFFSGFYDFDGISFKRLNRKFQEQNQFTRRSIVFVVQHNCKLVAAMRQWRISAAKLVRRAWWVATVTLYRTFGDSWEPTYSY